MPFSSDAFDATVLEFLRDLPKLDTFLDIGAGAGKYGRMVRDTHFTAHSTAVEVDQDYVEEYKLSEIYDVVLLDSAMSLIDVYVDESFDLVVIGDCIEHLRKSEGADLLNFLVYRCKHLLVIFPEHFVQGSWEGHKSEAHISVWGESDFVLFDHTFERRGQICMAAIRGYLS